MRIVAFVPSKGKAVQELEPRAVRVDLENSAVVVAAFIYGHPIESGAREGEAAFKNYSRSEPSKLCRSWNPVPSVLTLKIVPSLLAPPEKVIP